MLFDSVFLTAILFWVIMMTAGFIWVIVRDIVKRLLRDEDYTDYRGG